MRRNPAFNLLEALCTELAGYSQRVVDAQSLDIDLREQIKKEFNETADAVAVESGIIWLDKHFAARGSSLPFTWQAATWEFQVTDPAFVAFIANAKNGRSVGGLTAKEFEIATAMLLWGKLTGEIHRVGDPRTAPAPHRALVAYLQKLGFDKTCLEPLDRDGGFDILWLPPLGAIPIRPVVVVQCKNSYFNEEEATKSAGRAKRTLKRHSVVRGHDIVYAVFNDYIDEQYVGRACGWIFVPLGLSDLAKVSPQAAPAIL